MFSRISSIGVAVKDMERACNNYTEKLGLEISETLSLPDLGIRMATLPVGNASIELIEPLNKDQGPVSNYLNIHGEGVYLVEVRVRSMHLALQSLRNKSARIIFNEPQQEDSPLFIHPKDTNGVLFQIKPEE